LLPVFRVLEWRLPSGSRVAEIATRNLGPFATTLVSKGHLATTCADTQRLERAI
jgi:hypothetical protein